MRRDAAALGVRAGRTVRDHASTTLTLRPRRGRCGTCGATQVLLLGSVLPRRADTTAVIGTALLASARGAGYRRIAEDIGRPLSTVRRWLRSVRDARTQWLHAQGVPAWTLIGRLTHGRLVPARAG
jgi:Homeodomain-like domain